MPDFTRKNKEGVVVEGVVTIEGRFLGGSPKRDEAVETPAEKHCLSHDPMNQNPSFDALIYHAPN